MYRVAICDDELVYLETVVAMMSRIFKKLNIQAQIDKFSCPQQLFTRLQQKPDQYHLLLLDILMEPISGIELARRLRQLDSKSSIVFISGTAAFSLECYAVFPNDYLVKPVMEERLTQVIHQDYLKHFLPRHLLLPIKHGHIVIGLTDICYIEAINRTIILHLGEEKREYAGTLRKLLKLLPQNLYVRCHKSFALNLGKVAEISVNEVVLLDGSKIPLGRAYRAETLQTIISFLDCC